MNDERRAAGLYLAHLVDCALHDAEPDPKPDEVAWESVHALAVANSMEGASWASARARAADMPGRLCERWGQEADATLFRLLRFDVEREAVLGELAAHGLSYLPLKGVLMARYYPHPEMRSMADNDILYGFVEAAPEGGFRICGATEAERAIAVREATNAAAAIMGSRGYRAESLHRGNHDTFLREPFCNFELHRALMSLSSGQRSFFENPWRRALRDRDDPFGFHFSDEDEYLYHIAHAFKHYDMSGCGIRFLADIEAFLVRKGASLDERYLEQQLDVLGLTGFESRMRGLAIALFGGTSDGTGTGLSAGQVDELQYLLGCGTYGTLRVNLERRVDKLLDEGGGLEAAKRGYVRQRLLMREEDRLEYYPVLGRYKLLFPAFLLVRIGKAAFKTPAKVARELKLLRHMDR